jgi:hypothetical protein
MVVSAALQCSQRICSCIFMLCRAVKRPIRKPRASQHLSLHYSARTHRVALLLTCQSTLQVPFTLTSHYLLLHVILLATIN